MSNEKFEPIEFGSWQELAKYAIDGNDVYFMSSIDGKYIKVVFSGAGFNCDIERVFDHRDIYIKKTPTLEEFITIKPRLFWVWDDCAKDKRLRLIKDISHLKLWLNHEMLSDDEIKQFLDNEPPK